jgi:AcrR family transcriptional regulator
LLVAVHQEAVRQISGKIEAALAKSSADPWQRLSDASAAYLESMLGPDRNLAAVIVAEFPRRQSKALRTELLSNREAVEGHFRKLVAELPLRRGIDRSLWRLALMGQLAWTFSWYKKGGRSPDDIARRLVQMLREKTQA